jgi:hypothetical protein
MQHVQVKTISVADWSKGKALLIVNEKPSRRRRQREILELWPVRSGGIASGSRGKVFWFFFSKKTACLNFR